MLLLKIDIEQARILKGWQRFIQNGELMYNISAPIVRSWLRCQSNNLSAVKLLPEKLPLYPETIQAFPPGLLASFGEFIAIVFDRLAEHKLLLTLVDAKGVLVNWKGNKGFLLTGPLNIGTDFREESLGTMAVGLTLKEQKTYITRGAEHYYSCYHGLVNCTVPLITENNFVGVLSGWSLFEQSDFM
ncbi:MAG: hypothetical protein WDA53_09400, partial [Bacillota bacterium]